MKPSNLKAIRLDLGLSRGACAEGMSVTRQTIYNIESGKSKKSSEYFYELYLKNLRRARQYAYDKRTKQ